MAHQAYKSVNIHYHEIYVWKILAIFIYARTPHLVWVNVDVQSDLATLMLNNGEKLEYFHSIILILQ